MWRLLYADSKQVIVGYLMTRRRLRVNPESSFLSVNEKKWLERNATFWSLWRHFKMFSLELFITLKIIFRLLQNWVIFDEFKQFYSFLLSVGFRSRDFSRELFSLFLISTRSVVTYAFDDKSSTLCPLKCINVSLSSEF